MVPKVNDHFNQEKTLCAFQDSASEKKKRKNAKDWNRSEAVGDNKTCEHFEVLDRLGGEMLLL